MHHESYRRKRLRAGSLAFWIAIGLCIMTTALGIGVLIGEHRGMERSRTLHQWLDTMKVTGEKVLSVPPVVSGDVANLELTPKLLEKIREWAVDQAPDGYRLWRVLPATDNGRTELMAIYLPEPD